MEYKDRYVNWERHQDDDAHCEVCPTGYPLQCPCGGKVHADRMTMPDGGIVQLSRCARCGRPQAE
jgi:hypothetical protein